MGTIGQPTNEGGVSPTFSQVIPSALPPGVQATDLYPGYQEGVTSSERDKAGDLRDTPRDATPTGTRRSPGQSLMVTFELGDRVTINENSRSVATRGMTGVITGTKLQPRLGYVRVVITESKKALNVATKNLTLVARP